MPLTRKIILYRKSYFFAVVLLVCLNYLGFATTVFASTESGWDIRQSSNFAGTVFSDLTPHALKMHIGRLGLTIISKAPHWDALVFNENSKTYAELPYKRWQQRFALSANSSYRDRNGQIALTARKTGKMTTIENHKAYEYWIIKKGDRKTKVADEKISQLWIASDIKPPSQIAQIFCMHLGIPSQNGIPLKASRNYNGKMVSVLETLSVKQRKMSDNNFKPLPGYKKVKNEIELLMGPEDSMGDLLK